MERRRIGWEKTIWSSWSNCRPTRRNSKAVERFFEELRRKLEFRVFETLEQAEDFVSAAIQEFLQDKERVKSLTLFPYINYAHSILN